MQSGLAVIHANHLETLTELTVQWLQDTQTEDGGWGESCNTYDDAKLTGHGISTASQTAWALLGLIAAGGVAAYVTAFALAVFGFATLQVWWLMTLVSVAVLFAAIARGQYRTDRPVAPNGNDTVVDQAAAPRHVRPQVGPR